MKPDSPVTPSPHKRDRSRQRLLAAANRRFREQGYEAATVASIAREAGVTERTFFRYFPTKADVLVANWEDYADDLRDVLATDERSDVAAVITDALRAYLRGIEEEHDAGVDSLLLLYTDRAAFAAVTEHILAVEDDLSQEIGRRTGRSNEDFAVRVAANASLGVVRAAIRTRLSYRSGPTMRELFDEGATHLPAMIPSKSVTSKASHRQGAGRVDAPETTRTPKKPRSTAGARKRLP